MKLVDQLIFQIPCKSISNAIYEAMFNLLSKNAKLEKQAEIMKFIVEKIMFSQVCYYDITEELLNLVEQLINLNSDCTSIILPYIKEAMKIKRDGKERIKFSIQSAPRKGLTNLGATC